MMRDDCNRQKLPEPAFRFREIREDLYGEYGASSWPMRWTLGFRPGPITSPGSRSRVRWSRN